MTRTPSAIDRLRMGVALIAISTILLGAVAFFAIRRLTEDFNAISEVSVPVLARMHQLNRDTFSLIPPASALVAAPRGLDAARHVADLAERIVTLRRGHDSLAAQQGVTDRGLDDEIEALSLSITSLRTRVDQRPAMIRDARLDLLNAAAAMRGAEEEMVSRISGSLTDPQMTPVRMLALAGTLNDVRQVRALIVGLGETASGDDFARQHSLLLAQFRDLFVGLSRLTDLDLQRRIATLVQPVYLGFSENRTGEAMQQLLAADTATQREAQRLLSVVTRLQERTADLAVRQEASVTALRAESRGETLVVVAAMIVALISAVTAYGVIKRQILWRLKHAQQQAMRLRNGDLSPQQVLEGNDDISALSHHMEDLRRATLVRHALETELRRSRAEAEELVRSKSKLLSTMSHEVRTPLNAIMGIFELIEEADIPQGQKLCAQHGRVAAEGLFEILSRVLDSERLQAKALTPRIAPVALAELTAYLRVGLEGAARKSDNAVRTEMVLAPDLPGTIHTDGQRLKQILLNLVDNAVRFTPEGVVRLRVEPGSDARHLCFAVEDTGVGIPTEKHEEIFMQFRQLSDGVPESAGGSGLGLSITRALVEVLGGRIDLQSAPGKGSTFTVILPIEQPAAVAA